PGCPSRIGAAQHRGRRRHEPESRMSSPPAPVAFVAQLALLSLISFGGIPSILPGIHNLVVVTKGWATDREFADFYAIAQAMPGLPMILMMSLIGWKVGGLTGALASAVATCGPSSAVAFVAFRLSHRFPDARCREIIENFPRAPYRSRYREDAAGNHRCMQGSSPQ